MTPQQLRIIASSQSLTLLEQQQARTPWHEREYLREARLGLQREWVAEVRRVARDAEKSARASTLGTCDDCGSPIKDQSAALCWHCERMSYGK